MNKAFKVILLPLFLFYSLFSQGQIDESLIDQFVEDFPGMYGISDDDVRKILAHAEFKPDIIEKISKPAEGTMTWTRYRNIFMKEERIDAGVQFWNTHKDLIKDVSEKTGISEKAIIGILGVETYFGQRKGTYKVLDALYTLSFGYPKRSKFFSSELQEFIVLCHKENLNVYEIKGSYAGAIGYCQFMPSSYRAYAVSYDEDGSRDLSNQVGDAVASIANYLKVHRWETDGPVATKATTNDKTVALPKQSTKPKYKTAYYINQGYSPEAGDFTQRTSTLLEFELDEGSEFWFGFNNFYVITRYNHSPLYALAVFQLGEAVESKRENIN
jgi:membrane-bound lytic murein transglycosylase B